MPYTWSRESNRYRDTNTGRYVSKDSVLKAVRQSIDHSQDKIASLAPQLANGDLTPFDAKQVIREELKKNHIREYMLGKGGGKENMQLNDWGRVGGMLSDQYRYLDRFMGDIESGNLTEGQIRNRLNMYMNSGREAYERGQAASYGVPALPAYPGDGTTICLTNCRCSWQITREYTAFGMISGWRCTWTLSPVENCPTCLARAVAWESLFIQAGTVPNFEHAEDLFRQAVALDHDTLFKQLMEAGYSRVEIGHPHTH